MISLFKYYKKAGSDDISTLMLARGPVKISKFIYLQIQNCVFSSATADSPVSWRHEDPGRWEGRNPVQVFWSSTYQLHLAEVQKTSEMHTCTHTENQNTHTHKHNTEATKKKGRKIIPERCPLILSLCIRVSEVLIKWVTTKLPGRTVW